MINSAFLQPTDIVGFHSRCRFWTHLLRERDAIYGYLGAVFQIVARWKEQHRAKAGSHQALNANKQHGTIRTNEPFAVVIFIEWIQRR